MPTLHNSFPHLCPATGQKNGPKVEHQSVGRRARQLRTWQQSTDPAAEPFSCEERLLALDVPPAPRRLSHTVGAPSAPAHANDCHMAAMRRTRRDEPRPAHGHTTVVSRVQVRSSRVRCGPAAGKPLPSTSTRHREDVKTVENPAARQARSWRRALLWAVRRGERKKANHSREPTSHAPGHQV